MAKLSLKNYRSIVIITNFLITMEMKKLTIALLICTMITSLSCTDKNQSSGTKEITIVPKPLSINKLEGNFTLSAKTVIIIENSDELVEKNANYLKTCLFEKYNLSVEISKEEVKNANEIQFSIDETNLAPEAYILSINAGVIKITGGSAAGQFYAIQSLSQLLPPTNENIAELQIQNIEINDCPLYKWRGMHLDVCRHFYSVEEVKKLIDAMAMHKLNVFHWHLTEDQGWRIEIKKYPKLTEISAWREETVVGHMAEYPHKFDGTKHGGFYTQQQIKEVIQYAAERHITIVPEIEMPGHAVAALAAYPEFSCTDGTFEVYKLWGISDDVYCAGKEATFEFIENVLAEVVELFPSEYIHIGGDECPKTRWKVCPDCQKRIKTEKLADELELQSYFIKRIEKFLNAKGKKLIGWDEILEGGLPERAAVMSWRGISGGIEAATQGHDVVMTPGDFCYFDHYQAPQNEPLSIGGLTTLEDVYSFDPIPAELPADKKHHILGAQANVWTEYILTPQHLEYMIYPRLCAMAEVLWTSTENRNWNDFKNRMAEHYLRLDSKNINYRVDAPSGFSDKNFTLNDTIVVEINCNIPNAKIYYTTDNSEPTPQANLYAGAFAIGLKNEVVIKAKTYLPNGKSSTTTSGLFAKANYFEASEIENPANGLLYSYYEGETSSALQMPAKFVEKGIIEDFAMPKNAAPNFIALEYEGFLEIDANNLYTFWVESDDGSVLFIDNQEVVNNNGFHYGQEKSGQIALRKGFHKIKLCYFQAQFGGYFSVFWGSDKIEKTEINNSKLFYTK